MLTTIELMVDGWMVLALMTLIVGALIRGLFTQVNERLLAAQK